MTDTETPVGTSMYLYAVECGFSEGIEFINNNFDISTTSGQSGASSVYVLQVATSEASFIGNNITSESNGPIVGIFSPYGYGPAKDLIIKENVFNITGLATGSSDYALISGIEIQTGYATISNNTINVHNKGGYNDSYPVSGISAIQYSASTLSFDIQNNEVYVPDGKYAVDIRYAPQNAKVIGNALCAHELTGDAAVYIKSGNNNTVKDNLLGYVIPKTGESTYNIPANVSSFKVYDDGGMGRTYSPGCAGTLTLTAPEGYRLQLSGNIKTEQNDDYLTVYDGSSNEADVLIDQMSSSDNGTSTAIPTVTSTGQSLTFYFCSNSSNSDDSEFDGLDLTVTLIYNLNETDGITTADVENLQGKLAVFSRTFTKGVTSTICLPFPMTSLTGGDLYGFQDVAYDETEGAWVADFNQLEAVTVDNMTVAGMPYLFVADAEEEGDVTVLFSGTVPDDFDGTPGTGTAGVGDVWTLHGTYTQLTYGNGELANYDYVYGFAGQAYADNNISAGNFVKLGGTAYVPPFRCYLTYSEGEFTGAPSMSGKAGTEMPNRIIVRLLGKDGTVTAIGTMDTKTGNVTFGDEWYSLDGRRVQGQPTQKGVYVNNGKKVVIK